MTETNNRSACSLDDKRQVKYSKLSIRSGFRLSLRKLSYIEEKLFYIKKIEP